VGNPFSYIDGRWFNADGTIDTSGRTPYFTSGRQMYNSFLGIKPGDGGGGGYSFSGNSAGSMFNYFANGGSINGISFNKGKATWWTGTATQTSYRIGDEMYGNGEVGVMHTANVANSNFLDLGLIGNANDAMGGFAEGLSYNAKTGSKLYIGTARPNSPINLGFTKFYGNGRTYINPAYMGKPGNILGKASIAGTVIIGSVNIYNGIQQDGGSFGHNAAVATGGTVGGAIGAYEGAILGAEIGAGIGVWVGGLGAAPGALIGGVVGGVIGGIVGTKVGESVVYY